MGISVLKPAPALLKKYDAGKQILATNKYLSILSKAVAEEAGVLDKYIDTIVMGFWGPPFSGEEDHAYLACRAILKQQQLLPAIFALLDEMDIRYKKEELYLRAGLSTGHLVVGNMGSEQSKSYTVLGDTVNTSSRLKGASVQYGVDVLISGETKKQAGRRIISREIDLIQVIGKDEPVSIYEILGETGQTGQEIITLKESFEKGLAEYRNRQWDLALSEFKTCLKLKPGDRPSQIFTGRIEAFKKNPPGEEWDGVWQLSKK